MAKADILIAEDDPVLQEVYTKKFSLAGYSIRIAKNGEEAIEEMTKKVPDALILDLNMPVLDGFSVMEKFPRGQRSFPVIILTNFGNEKNRKRGDELGADDYFVKSEMTIKSLLEMVEKVLKSKNAP